jgi:RNA exonuclease NGL2
LRDGTLDAHAREEILRSSVMHRSIDEARARAQAGIEGEDDVEEEGDDEPEENGAAAGQAEEKKPAAPEADSDHMLKNCRAASADDGLLSIDELVQLHKLDIGKAVSAYGSYYSHLEGESEEGNYFGVSLPDWCADRHG